MVQPNEPLSPHPTPPPDFNTRILPIIESQGIWYRLNPAHHSSALYFDKSGRGRFDSPQQGYGILYAAEDVRGAFIECFGRKHGAIGVAEADLAKRNLFEITSSRPLKLVQLWGNGLTKIGVDARLASGSYLTARQWCQAIWEHPQQVDGIQYYSRHDDTRILIGLFDRTQPYLKENNIGILLDEAQLLAEILEYYNYGLL